MLQKQHLPARNVRINPGENEPNTQIEDEKIRLDAEETSSKNSFVCPSLKRPIDMQDGHGSGFRLRMHKIL